MMATWTFLTNHAWALLFVAHDPEVRWRDIAASRGHQRTQRLRRTLTDLAEAGDVLALLAGTDARP